MHEDISRFNDNKLFPGKIALFGGKLEASKGVHIKMINTVDNWFPIRNVALWETFQVACAEFDWSVQRITRQVLPGVVDGHLHSLLMLKVSLNGHQRRVTMKAPRRCYRLFQEQ